LSVNLGDGSLGFQVGGDVDDFVAQGGEARRAFEVG
jgi:hypothetical protein